MESEPLDHQGSPWFYFLRQEKMRIFKCEGEESAEETGKETEDEKKLIRPWEGGWGGVQGPGEQEAKGDLSSVPRGRGQWKEAGVVFWWHVLQVLFSGSIYFQNREVKSSVHRGGSWGHLRCWQVSEWREELKTRARIFAGREEPVWSRALKMRSPGARTLKVVVLWLMKIYRPV